MFFEILTAHWSSSTGFYVYVIGGGRTKRGKQNFQNLKGGGTNLLGHYVASLSLGLTGNEVCLRVFLQHCTAD